MTSSDKVIIGSTVVIAASALTMLLISKKYDDTVKSVDSDLKDIHYLLSRNREDIIAGNKELIEGNRILRDIVRNSAEARVVKNKGGA